MDDEGGSSHWPVVSVAEAMSRGRLSIFLSTCSVKNKLKCLSVGSGNELFEMTSCFLCWLDVIL